VPTSKPPPSRPPSRPPPQRSHSPFSLRLASLDFDLANAARRIVESSLGVVAGDRVVVIVDSIRESLGETLAEVARALGATAEVVLLENLVKRPARTLPGPLRDELARAQASILLIGFEEGEWSMRREIVEMVSKLRLRHAHMVGVGRKALLSAFSVDPQAIVDVTRAVRTRLRPDSVIKLRSAAGSDLEVKLDPAARWQERAGFIRQGRWENLPSGELFTCPADVNGVFVCDASMGGPIGAAAGVLTRSPIRVEVRGGACRAVQCADRVLSGAIDSAMRAERNADRVGLVILGTNVGIGEPTGEIAADQNLPGLHLAFGATFKEQTGASWDAAAQLVMCGARADVDLDGAPLLRSGRYLVL
jgi:aminopeptidase